MNVFLFILPFLLWFVYFSFVIQLLRCLFKLKDDIENGDD